MSVSFENGRYGAVHVAEWLVSYARTRDADLSLSKLQKILYYVQHNHVFKYGMPLFDEEIEVRDEGPFIPDVARHFAGSGSRDLHEDYVPDFYCTIIDNEDLSVFLGYVFRFYAKYGASGLRGMIAEELPYVKALRGGCLHVDVGGMRIVPFYSPYPSWYVPKNTPTKR